MQVIETVTISGDLHLDVDDGGLKHQIEMINNEYWDIDKTYQFESHGQYLCLGYTGMADDIVLVSETGRVFKLPYDEDFID